ncbi:MAG: hypothetical protein QOD66_2447 [Solirubrobacteraceae bacterium]|jgi:hypothetical protein|nr:hypothetical protein [Solirubrobacteraceae bacterium]
MLADEPPDDPDPELEGTGAGAGAGAATGAGALATGVTGATLVGEDGTDAVTGAVGGGAAFRRWWGRAR